MSMCLSLARVMMVLVAVLVLQFRWLLTIGMLLWAFDLLAAPADDMRAALNANFGAYNAEDAAAMRATIDQRLPGLDEFQQQAEALFAETDSYISVRDFEVLAIRGNQAKARVVQHTSVSGVPDNAYRQKSMLMPKYPTVEYVQYFTKVKGQWKLGLVEAEPRQVEDTAPTQNIAPAGRSVFGNCANGNCSRPILQ
jgi:hypothetical protein